MAIIGLDKFADFFKGYEECYLLQIIPDDETVRVTGDVADAVDRFSSQIVSDNIVFSDLGINTTMEQE